MNKTGSCLISGLQPQLSELFRKSAVVSVQALFVFVLLFTCCLPGRAGAGLIRPLEGSGNFHSIVDVYNHRNDDGKNDVTLLIAVSNSELTFVAEEAHLQARIRAQVEITGPTGRKWMTSRRVSGRTTNRAELNSGSMYQIFAIMLKNVPVHSGRLVCRIVDENRTQTDLVSMIQDDSACSIAVANWRVEPERRLRDNLVLGDPLFLDGAPIELWGTNEPLARELERSEIFSSIHPNRRYGLEQDRLQVFFEIEPPSGGGGALLGTKGIAMQVLAKDLDFALRDTIEIDDVRLRLLEAGRSTGVFFELDVNALPPGPYQLSCWPIGGAGRGWLAEFDVVWSMDLLNRHRDELLGEGRTVLMGDDLRNFLDAGQAEREAILAGFWADQDPDKETSVNEAYLEFRERVSYVRSYLGGFNSLGAVDPRGNVYLLLGEPDVVDSEPIPNMAEFEEALVRVHDRYDKLRKVGVVTRSSPGKANLEVPYMTDWEVMKHKNSILRDKAFELWIYDHRGQQLFDNMYTHRNLGISFLFVDRRGSGHYHLLETNDIDVR